MKFWGGLHQFNTYQMTTISIAVAASSAAAVSSNPPTPSNSHLNHLRCGPRSNPLTTPFSVLPPFKPTLPASLTPPVPFQLVSSNTEAAHPQSDQLHQSQHRCPPGLHLLTLHGRTAAPSTAPPPRPHHRRVAVRLAALAFTNPNSRKRSFDPPAFSRTATADSLPPRCPRRRRPGRRWRRPSWP